jgi:hypothetical protein
MKGHRRSRWCHTTVSYQFRWLWSRTMSQLFPLHRSHGTWYDCSVIVRGGLCYYGSLLVLLCGTAVLLLLSEPSSFHHFHDTGIPAVSYEEDPRRRHPWTTRPPKSSSSSSILTQQQQQQQQQQQLRTSTTTRSADDSSKRYHHHSNNNNSNNNKIIHHDPYNSDIVVATTTMASDPHNSDTIVKPSFSAAAVVFLDHEEDTNSSDDGVVVDVDSTERNVDADDDDDTDDADAVEGWENDATMQRILGAEVHLIDIRLDLPELRRDLSNEPYAGIYASFCTVDWTLHKTHPNVYPMFVDLIQHSPQCKNDEHIIRDVALRTVANMARKYDQQQRRQHQALFALVQPTVKVLELTTAIFHESRCGSTLLANLLAAMNPIQHRVYSEARAPMQALSNICGEDYSVCSPETAAAMLKDVIYLMSRTNDMKEERVFFKFPSAAARNLPVFINAFPNVPYLLLYRDPVQVMVSHFHPTVKDSTMIAAMSNDSTNAPPKPGTTTTVKCIAQRHSPGVSIVAAVQKYAHHPNNIPVGTKSTNIRTTKQRSSSPPTTTFLHAKEISDTDYCAAHLASITETMVSSVTANGYPINYRDLPDIFYQDVLPKLLSRSRMTGSYGTTTPISHDEFLRMQAMASLYSKNRIGGRGSTTTTFVDTFVADHEYKNQLASEEIRAAAATYLLPSYNALEELATTLHPKELQRR